MNRIINIGLGLLLCIIVNTSLFSQVDKKVTWAVYADFNHQDILGGTDAISIGLLGVVHDVKVRPSIRLGGQGFLKKNETKNYYLKGELSYYNNTYNANWYSINLGIGAEKRYFKRLIVAYGLHAGYARVKESDVQYIYENDEWIPTPNSGEGFYSFTFGPELKLGYRVLEKENPIDVFINGRLMLQDDPVLEAWVPFNALGIGVRYGL